MGATNFIGKRPTASELRTNAGRVFLISDPIVGSKVTRQISPRLGLGGLVVDNVATLPLLTLGQFWICLVKLCYLVGLTSEDLTPLGNRQSHESPALFEGHSFCFL